MNVFSRCERHSIHRPKPSGPQLTLTARIGAPRRRPDDVLNCPDCRMLGPIGPDPDEPAPEPGPPDRTGPV